MASKARSIKLSHDLDALATKRWQDLGYPSFNAYIKGLIRYDATVQGEHQLTVPWSHLPLHKQEKVDAELRDLTAQGVGQRGQYLKKVLNGEA